MLESSDKMSKRIIEKYKELNQECKKYNRIQLSVSHESPLFPKIVEPEKDLDFAEEGFIEVFCLEEEQKEKVKNMRLKQKR